MSKGQFPTPPTHRRQSPQTSKQSPKSTLDADYYGMRILPIHLALGINQSLADRVLYHGYYSAVASVSRHRRERAASPVLSTTLPARTRRPGEHASMGVSMS
jgi:hypothetical protein